MIKKIIIVLIGLLTLTACQIVETTPTIVRTIAVKQTEKPLDRNTFTPYPPRRTPTPTITPYATTSAVNANAVVFIGEGINSSFNSSLWVANIDGSGERKLLETASNSEWTSLYFLKWSPDRKWISYLAADDLWIISPDSLVSKKLLEHFAPRSGLSGYVWSPDGSKIAYQQIAVNEHPKTPTPGPESGIGGPFVVGIMDIPSGKISELSHHHANIATTILSWSPDGRYLLFAKNYSFVLYDIAARKIVKEMKRDCGLGYGITWSPNGQWFSHVDHGNGRYTYNWICLTSLADRSTHEIQVEGTTSSPVWDKTGNFLYFVARKTNPDSDPNLKIDEWLMRYDVRTRKSEHLLVLREKQTEDYLQSISISPDRQTLLLKSKASKTTYDLTFVDIPSLAQTKFIVDFDVLKVPFFYSYFLETAWSPDSQKLVLLAGDVCTPDRTCIQYYGSFYTLDVKTRKTTAFSGSHQIDRWLVSPIAAFP